MQESKPITELLCKYYSDTTTVGYIWTVIILSVEQIIGWAVEKKRIATLFCDLAATRSRGSYRPQ